MRSAKESRDELAPTDLTLADIEEELVANLGVPRATASAWTVAVQSYDNDVKTAGDVKAKMDKADFEDTTAKAGMGIMQVLAIQICLGSAARPFQFDEKEKENSQAVNKDVKAVKGKKGGSLTEVADRLLVRRPALTAYCPPVQFDAHRLGMPTRDESVLRQLIVVEVRTLTLERTPPSALRQLTAPCLCRYSRSVGTSTRPVKSAKSCWAPSRSTAAPLHGRVLCMVTWPLGSTITSPHLLAPAAP